ADRRFGARVGAEGAGREPRAGSSAKDRVQSARGGGHGCEASSQGSEAGCEDRAACRKGCTAVNEGGEAGGEDAEAHPEGQRTGQERAVGSGQRPGSTLRDHPSFGGSSGSMASTRG